MQTCTKSAYVHAAPPPPAHAHTHTHTHVHTHDLKCYTGYIYVYYAE